jgi:hypothetical protein
MRHNDRNRSTPPESASILERLGPLAAGLVILCPLVAAAIFYVGTHVTTVDLGYTLARARKQHEASLEASKGLALEVAALKAPERLQKLAGPLGLLQPSSDQVVFLGTPDAVAEASR